MKRNNDSHTTQDPRSPWTGHQTTKKEFLPLTAKLLQNLEEGITPNILDIMGCFSEFVAFYTEDDTNSEITEIEKYIMSQNKCRFCS